MNSSGLTPEKAFLHFIKENYATVARLSFQPTYWDTIFFKFKGGLSKDAVIQTTGSGAVGEITAAGHRVVVSPFKSYYIDNVGWTWKDVYNVEPLETITSESQAKLVLGGEVLMWGENVDGSDLLSSIWPRAASAAERLWSSRSVNSPEEFLSRLQAFRCHMLERGIAAAPVLNPEARNPPLGAGSCRWQ